MKIKVNRDHLFAALAQATNILHSSGASLPILSCTLIDARENRLTITANNLDHAVRCSIAATVAEPGIIALPAKRLAEIVRELPQVDVSIATNDKERATIKAGESTFTVSGFAATEYPAWGEVKAEKMIDIDQATLAVMIRGVAFAQSTDESRYTLKGIFFDAQAESLALVATDGRRLSVANHPTAKGMGTGKFILPSNSIAALVRLLGSGTNVKIVFNERQVAFEIDADKAKELTGTIEYISKIVEGTFPNYQQVIPKETTHRVEFERESLAECVHRAALVCSEKANSVKLGFDKGMLSISAQSPDFGEALDTLAIAYDGPEAKIAFNPAFLLDPLRSLVTDKIAFEFKDEMSPGVLRSGERFVCVVMPVRLS
jgi:DNA polymerase-3 subunit beta